MWCREVFGGSLGTYTSHSCPVTGFSKDKQVGTIRLAQSGWQWRGRPEVEAHENGEEK